MPGPRGDRDGFDFLHMIGAFFGMALVLFIVVAVALLLWNSFKVRSEVRALRDTVAQLGSGELAGAGGAATAASSEVNTGAIAVPPARASVGMNTEILAVPPAPKAPRAPRAKPTDMAE